MKQRGSALIISMMLIATIGAAAFGIARLLYADTSMSSTYENGTIAYYAAESGIEEGFLRYKYNMNAEVPYADPINNIFWTYGDNKVFRTNLFTETVDKSTAYDIGIPSSTPITDSTKQFYDLRMGYLGTNLPNGGPFFYHDVNGDGKVDGIANNYSDIFSTSYSSGDYDKLRIPKDEARTFDLSNVNLAPSANQLNVGFKFIGVNTNPSADGYTDLGNCQAMAEVKFLVNGGEATAKEYKMLTNYNPGTCEDVPLFGISASKLDSADPSFATGGYINATGNTYSTENTNYFYALPNILTTALTKAGGTISPSDKVIMTIKPLYYPVDIYFTTQACKDIAVPCPDHNQIVTGPNTYMTSTGYYGGVTRTLTANIDRQSGTLYDLYNYVLFKGN